ncbi:MAG: tetratricopeptide repeat protein [Tannerellaceae bacterium]|jgi:pentatricopeptide repeat protein|nr:tetratricopeptide repeat protein [Tannerellaceae bacterium]
MKQDEISMVLQRFLAACKKGTEQYFDADEIDAVLESFEDSDDFTHYEALLTLGLRLHPDNTDLKLRQCKFFLINEEYRQALDLLDSLPDVNREDADMIRLECYCMLGEYDKVVEYLELMTKNNCDYLEYIFEFLAPVLSDLGMMAEAADFIKRGRRLFPDNLVLKEELCYLLEVEGNFEQAMHLCNELIDREPYSYDYWFMLGRLYSHTNDFDNAIDAFDFALTCDDSDDELKVLKAYCLFMNENYEKAIEAYSELITDNASGRRIRPLMAECFIKLENFEQAYLLLKDIIYKQSGGGNVATYISFIRCCVETDRDSEASQMLSKAAEKFPDNVRILSLQALHYLENGKDDLALQTTRRILRQLGADKDEEDKELEELIRDGKYELTPENLNKIIKYYKKAIRHNPHLSFKDKPIPPEELAKEYLSERNNNN